MATRGTCTECGKMNCYFITTEQMCDRCRDNKYNGQNSCENKRKNREWEDERNIDAFNKSIAYQDEPDYDGY